MRWLYERGGLREYIYTERRWGIYGRARARVKGSSPGGGGGARADLNEEDSLSPGGLPITNLSPPLTSSLALARHPLSAPRTNHTQIITIDHPLHVCVYVCVCDGKGYAARVCIGDGQSRCVHYEYNDCVIIFREDLPIAVFRCARGGGG